jgi:flavin reductase
MSGRANEIDLLASVSAADFKTAMRRVASTVNVITSGCGTVLNGMTATAVCSVSADPPSVLIVVNQENRSHALIEQSGAYTVNVLSASQEALAAHFASSSIAPFATVPHSLGLNKCPIIDNCTSFLECVVESRMRCGTHSIFIGRVIASGESDSFPLLYHDGRFSYLLSNPDQTSPT